MLFVCFCRADEPITSQMRRPVFKLSSHIANTILLLLIEKHTMAISLKVAVGNLLLKLAAHTLIVLGALKSAGTVSARAAKPLLDGLYDFAVLIIPYLHLCVPMRASSFYIGTYPIDRSSKVSSLTNATV